MVLNGFDFAVVLAVIFLIEVMFFVIYRSYKVERDCKESEKTQRQAWEHVFSLIEARTSEQNALILNLKQELGIEEMVTTKMRLNEENEAFDKQMGYNLEVAYGSTPISLKDKEE